MSRLEAQDALQAEQVAAVEQVPLGHAQRPSTTIGVSSGTVSLTASGMTGTSVTSAGGPNLAIGERYLVAGDGEFAWACGFTQPYDPRGGRTVGRGHTMSRRALGAALSRRRRP